VILARLEKVSVSVENRHDRTMPSTNGDLLRTGSRRNPKSDRGMPEVMDSKRI
jgi:hypothetical protein